MAEPVSRAGVLAGMLALTLFAVACATPVPDAPATEAAMVSASEPATVGAAFPPPRGTVRAEADDFGLALRALPLRASDAPIRTYDGRTSGHHGRAIDMPLVPGDLQQCADSIMRVRGEYLRSRGQDVSFHSTSGTPLPWSRFEKGERVVLDGNDLRWTSGSPATWDQYLVSVFTWAGTSSLAALDTKPDDHLDPGDLLVDPGFPGHAVLLLDVARSDDATYVLVAEGYMPAQDFHVELGPDAGWWRWDDGLVLPHWIFAASALRTWR